MKSFHSHLLLLFCILAHSFCHIKLEYEDADHSLFEEEVPEDINLDVLETMDTDTRAIGKVHLDEYFTQGHLTQIPRRRLQNILLMSETMLGTVFGVI